MAGNREGGLKTAVTNRQLYGANYYQAIGVLGGQKSRGGGFAKNRELARAMGKIGGSISKRRKATV